ncbi:MAG: hypothetical protein HYY84_10785 [Deltaproteobacteria bacterium]|nr:hypothetical protein [Deltaproteobacteria bacterium]
MFRSLSRSRFSLLALFLAFGACGKESSNTSTTESDVLYTTANLDNAPSEEDNSGDAGAIVGDEEEAQDCTANADSIGTEDSSGEGDSEDSLPQNLGVADAGTKKHAVVQLLWGNLGLSTTMPSATTWDGSLSVSGGTIKKIRKIRFEEGNDAGVEGGDQITAETDTSITFTSKTKPNFDGLLFLVSRASTAAASSVTLTFTSAAVTTPISTTLDQLVGLPSVTTVGTDGNAVSFQAIPLAACSHGFMRGRWKRIDSRGGVFRGHWIRANGKAKGFLEGVWGTNSRGKQVFFGRFLSLDGRIRGRLIGRYNSDKVGGIFMRNGNVKGLFRAHTWDLNSNGRGHFSGHWMRFCSKYLRCQDSATSSPIGTTDAGADAGSESSDFITTAFQCASEATTQTTCTACP